MKGRFMRANNRSRTPNLEAMSPRRREHEVMLASKRDRKVRVKPVILRPIVLRGLGVLFGAIKSIGKDGRSVFKPIRDSRQRIKK